MLRLAHYRSSSFFFPTLWALLLPLGGPAGAEDLREVPEGWDDAPPRIEWAGGWEATYAANEARWKKELARGGEPGKARGRQLRWRLVRLLEALVARFPEEKDRRRDGYATLASHLDELGDKRGARLYRQRLVEEFPESTPVVLDALEEILARARLREEEDSRYSQNTEPIEFAAAKLLDLRASGAVSRDAPLFLDALRKLAYLRMAQGRFPEARGTLDTLEQAAGQDASWRSLRESLLRLAGRPPGGGLAEEPPAVPMDNAAGEAREDDEDAPPRSGPVTFLRSQSLEVRLSALRSGMAARDPQGLSSFLEESARSDALIQGGDGLHASLWVVLDRAITTATPTLTDEDFVAIRAAQEGSAAPFLKGRGRTRALRDLFPVYRRLPWAASVHRALQEQGETALLRGHAGIAYRCFQDVLRHSTDEQLLSRARVGAWLALCQEAAGESLPAAFARVDPDARHSFLGVEKTTAAIRERLKGTEAIPVEQLASFTPLADRTFDLLEIPPVIPWGFGPRSWRQEHRLEIPPSPLGRLQAAGSRVLLAAPNLLACYDADTRRLRWSRRPAGVREEDERPRVDERHSILPGPFRPCVAGGRVYTRWEVAPPGRYLTTLAAFELEGGEMVWSTQGQESWASTLPLSDPVMAHDRVYVLVTREGPVYANPVILVCLDARTGEKLWERLLGSRPLALPVAGLRELPREVLDVVRWGNAVTVRGGAVYCSTNLGFVARCDARDGLVEWVRTYPRFRLGWDPRIVARRQGMSPVVRGGAVVFAPRDLQGAFALHAETGQLLWDRPFLPSTESVGPAGGALLLRDDHVLAAVKMASGELVWKKGFPSGTLMQAVVHGSACLVGDSEKLHALDAGTGRALEEISWSQSLSRDETPGPPGAAGSRAARLLDPPRDFVPVADGVLAVTDRSVETSRDAAALEAVPVRTARMLPLRRIASVSAPGRLVWPPASDDRPGGDAYLMSGEVLTALATEPHPLIRWRRFLPAGARKLHRLSRKLLLLYPRRVLALDSVTGALLWKTDLPIESDVLLPLRDRLFVGSMEGRRGGAVVDLDTGRILWQRALGQGENGAVVGSGTELHVIADGVLPDGRRTRGELVDSTLDVETGRIRASRTVSPVEERRNLVPSAAPRSCFFVHRGALYEYHPLSGRKVLHQVNFDRRGIRGMELRGSWLVIRRHGGEDSGDAGSLLLRRMGTSSRMIRRSGNSTLLRGHLHELVDGTLRLTDLSTGRERSFELPSDRSGSLPGDLLHAEEHQGSLWVVSVVRATRAEDSRLRVDVLDAADGVHRGSQLLEGIALRFRHEGEWEDGGTRFLNRAWLGGGALWVTDGEACHLFVPAGPLDQSEKRAFSAHLASGAMVVDGFQDDWEEQCTVPVPGPGGTRGELHLVHDGESLHVGLRYPDPHPSPLGGSVRRGSGDRLELEIATSEGPLQVLVGFDARWQSIVESRRWDEPGRDVLAAVAGSGATGMLAYEVALPLSGIGDAGQTESRLVALSMALRDDGPGGAGPERTVVLGNKPARTRPITADRKTVCLLPLTHRGEVALTALIAGGPGLRTSFDVFERECRARALSAEDLARRQEAFIRKHPGEMTVERLLTLDRALRERRGADPSATILRAGEEAGVAVGILRRYLLQSRAYVSQWARVLEKGYPRSIVIEFHDGMGPRGWEHRVNLVKHYRSWPVRPPQLPDRIPGDDWYELRIPLVYLGINDTPICGVSWTQQGPPGIAWDRTSVVFGGKETVFLDDTPGGGGTSGGWRWISSPARSGSRAHVGPPPASRYEVESHSVRRLTPPVTAHVTFPEGEPYLSQWVLVDPERPPRMISVRLHDGRGWSDFLLRGEKLYAGRYLGLLPPAGVWSELRVPLSWTHVGERPLVGVAFGQTGGKVHWDRTSVVAQGTEHVLIDDDLPPAAIASTRAGSADREPSDQRRPGPSFDAPPAAFGPGFLGDGVRARVEVPHSPVLDPRELTVEAWVYLYEYPEGREKRRWIVAKSGNEETDGHYALMTRWGQVGAYLNTGGTRDNRREAWSPAGVLGLRAWHHLAMTYDGQDLVVYLDGAMVGAESIGRARSHGSGPLTIGARPDRYVHFAGLIDEASVHDRALSPAEVRVRWEEGLAALRTGAQSLPPADSAVYHCSFDEYGLPPEKGAPWRWVERPSKSGRRAHTQETSPGYSSHHVLFPDSPVLVHLRADRERTASLVERHLADLGPTNEAREFVGEALELYPTEASRRVELCRAFLRGVPRHPGAGDFLDLLLEAHGNGPDGVSLVESFVAGTAIPPETLYGWRRRHLEESRPFVSSWRLLGPVLPEALPRAISTHLASPSGRRILDTRGWTSAEVVDGRVQVPGFHGPYQPIVAFAAARVNVPSICRAMLEVERSDCDVKVHLNRRLVLDSSSRPSLSLSELGAPIALSAGVNEILVELSAGGTGASFALEIVAPSGRSAPPGLVTEAP